MNEDTVDLIFYSACAFTAALLFAWVIVPVFIIHDIVISQDTANSICQNITNDTTATATSQNGNLVCILPSYDSTQNIIIRKNNEVKA